MTQNISKMSVNIQKLVPDAGVPTYAVEGDAGLDLTCTSVTIRNGNLICGTGLAIAIPPGYVGLLFPRSSIHKYELTLANSVGVIDSGYRGEIKVIFRLTDDAWVDNIYSVGDRVAQLVVLPYPKITFNQVSDLDDTVRGGDGFGSTGT